MIAVPLDTESPDKILIKFDFLDPKDGAVLEVLHTSEVITVDVCGTVVGLPGGAKEIGFTIRVRDGRVPSIIVRAAPITAMVGGLALAMTGIFASAETFLVAEKIVPSPSRNFSRAPLIVLGFLYTIPGFAFLYFGRRRYPKSLYIDGLSRRNRN